MDESAPIAVAVGKALRAIRALPAIDQGPMLVAIKAVINKMQREANTERLARKLRKQLEK